MKKEKNIFDGDDNIERLRKYNESLDKRIYPKIDKNIDIDEIINQVNENIL